MAPRAAMTERDELAAHRSYWEAYDRRVDAMLRNIVIAATAAGMAIVLGWYVELPLWLNVSWLGVAGAVVAFSGHNATRPILCPRCGKNYFGDAFKRHYTMRRCRYCGLPR